MAGISRLRISLSAGELEIEGDASLLSKYDADIKTLLARLVAGPGLEVPRGGGKLGAGTKHGDEGGKGGVQLDGDFGEILHQLPKSATATDQMLLAGLFAQRSGDDKSFATGTANTLLLDQGIKISNASQCMTNNLKARRVFKVPGGYRVSKPGEDHLAELIDQ
jgi:hypothetical protein